MKPIDFIFYMLDNNCYDNFMQAIYAYKDNSMMIVQDKVMSIKYNTIKHVIWHEENILIVEGDLDRFVDNIIKEYHKDVKAR